MVLYSLDSAKPSLERLTNSVHSLLRQILTLGFGHRKFHEKNKKKKEKKKG